CAIGPKSHGLGRHESSRFPRGNVQDARASRPLANGRCPRTGHSMKPDQRQLRKPTRPLRTVVVVVLALAAVTTVTAGCGLNEWAQNGGKVGPNYQPPPVAVEKSWIDYQDPRVKSEKQDLSHWWGVFDDPVLNSLLN